MAWSYRKRIKIAPGVNINLSKSGMSTSIGPKGAKMTVGPKGTYIHTSIPGTGLYSRRKLSSNKQDIGAKDSSSLFSGDDGGRVLQGCLVSWPRFLIWAAIIYLLYLSISRVHSRVIFGWELILYVLLIVGGLIVLWKINGGTFYDRVPKRRFFDILWLAVIIVGLLITGFHYYSKAENDVQNLPESTIVESETTVQEEGVLEPEEVQHQITEKGILVSLYVTLGLLLSSIISLGFLTRSKRLLQNVESRNNSIFKPSDIVDPETGEIISLDSFSTLLPDQEDRLIEAAQFVVSSQCCTTSVLQRTLGLGYAKTGRVLDQLEVLGIVSPLDSHFSRKVLVHSMDELESFLLSHYKANHGIIENSDPNE